MSGEGELELVARLLAAGAIRLPDPRNALLEFVSAVKAPDLFCTPCGTLVDKLAERALTFEAPPGTLLIAEEEPGDFMLLLLSGNVEVSRQSRLNVKVRLAVASPGQILGEMSMFDGAPRFASCTVLDRSRFVILSDGALKALEAERPDLMCAFQRRLLRLMGDRLRDTSLNLLDSIDRR